MFQIHLTIENSLERVFKVRFVDDVGGLYTSIRTKDVAAYPMATGSFQWTPGVQGLMILLVRYHLHGLGLLSSDEGMLRGEASSAASSLDYAISKQPEWLLEMFGCLPNGLSRGRTLFKRINSERKQGGAVSIFINPKQLKPASIFFQLEDGTPLTSDQKCALLTRLESRFITSKGYTSEGKRIAARVPLELKSFEKTRTPRGRLVPRRVEVVSLIPAYVGPAAMTVVDTETLGSPAISASDGAIIPESDGFGVLVSKATFTVASVPDFLCQRRERHLAMIAGHTSHHADLVALRERGRSKYKNERVPLGVAYVMSLHQVMNSNDEFSMNELRCMAEPSLLGIGDDPAEAVIAVEKEQPLPDSASADISVIGAPHFRCYVTWANVVMEARSECESSAEHILRFEVLLQRTWYKLHFLDELLRLNIVKAFGQREFERLLAGVRQDYFDLTRPDPRATSHFSEIRKTLVITSRITELFEVLQRRERCDLVA